MDVLAVIAQLKANKLKKPDILATPRNPVKRQNVNTSKHVGRFAGYCPRCGLMVAEEEAVSLCVRCGSTFASFATYDQERIKKKWLAEHDYYDQAWYEPYVLIEA